MVCYHLSFKILIYYCVLSIFCCKLWVYSLGSVSCSVVSNSLWPHACRPPGSSIHGFFQGRILEWIATSYSRESSWPKDQTWVSCISGRFFIIWATKEALFPLLTFDWNAPVVLKWLLLPALINCSRIFYEVFWASRQYNWCWKATRINESFYFPWSLRDELSFLNFALRMKIFNTGLWGIRWCISLMPSDLS